jgi:hypothetical protein
VTVSIKGALIDDNAADGVHVIPGYVSSANVTLGPGPSICLTVPPFIDADWIYCNGRFGVEVEAGANKVDAEAEEWNHNTPTVSTTPPADLNSDTLIDASCPQAAAANACP